MSCDVVEKVNSGKSILTILSKNLIEWKTGIKTRLFCYPNGSIGDFNDKTKLFVKKSGYSCALTTVRGMNSVNSDLYELKRFGVGNTDLKSFIVSISGVKFFLSKLLNIVHENSFWK